MTSKTLLPILVTGILLSSLPVQATPPPRDEPAVGCIRANARPRAGTDREIARYRAREAASPAAKSYRGGDGVIVIGASTVTVVLAVVLLVVLL